jgi:hypothetical protein
MTVNDKSAEMQTTVPTTAEEITNYNRFGSIRNALSSVTIPIQFLWAALEITALASLIAKGLSFYPIPSWIPFSISALALVFFQKLLKASYCQWLSDRHTLIFRPDKAKDMSITSVERLPYTALAVATFMFVLSVAGTQSLIETYGFKASHRELNTSHYDETIDLVSNQKTTAQLNIENKNKAAKNEESARLNREIANLEVKLTRVRASVNKKREDERAWIRHLIAEKRNELAVIAARFNAKTQREIAESNAKYSTQVDSLVISKQKAIDNNQTYNTSQDNLEASSKAKGLPTGIICSTLLLLIFSISQWKLKYYDVMCNLYDQHHYGFLQSIGGPVGAWKKTISTLWHEIGTASATAFYNRFTPASINTPNTGIAVNSNNSSVSATPTATGVSSVGTASYEEIEARFSLVRKRCNDYISHWERGTRRTQNTVDKIRENLVKLELLLVKTSDAAQKAAVVDYIRNVHEKLESFTNALNSTTI